MKKFLKVLVKTLVIIIITLGVLGGGLLLYLNIGNKGEVSAEVWDKTQGFDASTIQKLSMKEGEDFHILLFSDVQLSGYNKDDKAALTLVDELVGDVQPDFIMTTGDNAMMPLSDIMTKKFISQMEGYGIPWSVVLGNHDSEGRGDRAYFGNLYEAAQNSLFRSGPGNLQGVGNYVIDITDVQGEPVYSLIMLDSNIKRKYDSGSDYDYIYPEQIEWYEDVVQAQSDVPSMLIFHIPVPEYADAYEKLMFSSQLNPEGAFGEIREPVCCPPENTGLFDKVKELGNTAYIFCGHDHINDLSVEYEGVRLTYGLKTGPGSYSDDDMQGATLITISAGGEVTVEHIFR